MATADPYHEEVYWAGIDAGSVSLNCVVIDRQKGIVSELPYRRHLGKVEEGVVALIKELQARFREWRLRSVSFTGSHGRKLAESLGAFYEFETICQVAGALHVAPKARTIISMGGQQTALFQIGQNAGDWELEHFNTNGPCAAGTGSFIDQQAERLATTLYHRGKDAAQHDIDRVLADFIELGLRSENPAHVACRCTVFTKSDMIHLQNKGERLEDIIYGLHVGNARNYMSTIVGNRAVQAPVLFLGGLSLNPLQVRAFRRWFPELIVPPSSASMGALGVALLAREAGKEHGVDLERLRALQTARTLPAPIAPRLILTKTSFSDSEEITAKPRRCKTKVYLGIDIGSTTTKYALINEEREILHKKYVPTQGRPIEVTQRLLREMRSEIGDRIEILGTATTGSGRMVVGDFLNVELIIDEITAHARGAVEIDPAVDTVFEIGGQDSKYISIANTHPLDFDMNKVCAAGTGSFLHELANKYGINIVDEFQEIALSSERPVKLAERCTVFMESDLTAYHQRGVAKQDLMAGLCYAIVHNYLNRVVGRRPIGRKVMFLGGPSLNRAVVAAFEIGALRGKGVQRRSRLSQPVQAEDLRLRRSEECLGRRVRPLRDEAEREEQEGRPLRYEAGGVEELSGGSVRGTGGQTAAGGGRPVHRGHPTGALWPPDGDPVGPLLRPTGVPARSEPADGRRDFRGWDREHGERDLLSRKGLPRPREITPRKNNLSLSPHHDHHADGRTVRDWLLLSHGPEQLVHGAGGLRHRTLLAPESRPSSEVR
ncbi:MAG: CoA activase, partial [Deltaproteobacteria bacterium]|nr:CoA activase [Deltaproteobacteria bacterium]